MRKEYTKPTLTRVDLVPEEATLGACKTYGYKNAQMGGNDCVATGGCHDVGS